MFTNEEDWDGAFSHSKTNSPLWHQVRDKPISHSGEKLWWEIMKTFKSAQNIGNRARKCIWHCFSCEMGYLSTRFRSFTRLKGSWKISETCAEINPSRTRNNAICMHGYDTRVHVCQKSSACAQPVLPIWNLDKSNIIHFLTNIIISPNEGDIMVLTSRPPPVDPDDVNTQPKNIQPIYFKFYMW